MKIILKLTILTALFSSASVFAIQFNTSALKDMQNKGMELANQADKLKMLTTGNNKCLQIVGSVSKSAQGINLANCNGKINQKWRLDDKAHLISAGGQCLAYLGKVNVPNGTLATSKCSSAINQKWNFDAISRLKNGGNLCLDATATSVTSKACSDAASQKWTFK